MMRPRFRTLFLLCLMIALPALMSPMGWRSVKAETPAEAPIQLTVMTAVPERLIVSDELPGRVAAWRRVEIRPQVGGLILERLVNEGTRVKAGDVLFRIDPAPLKADLATAEAGFARAVATEAHSRRGLARADALLAKDVISDERHEAARNDLRCRGQSSRGARHRRTAAAGRGVHHLARACCRLCRWRPCRYRRAGSTGRRAGSCRGPGSRPRLRRSPPVGLATGCGGDCGRRRAWAGRDRYRTRPDAPATGAIEVLRRDCRSGDRQRFGPGRSAQSGSGAAARNVCARKTAARAVAGRAARSEDAILRSGGGRAQIVVVLEPTAPQRAAM